jgi:hypothetical protein
MSKALEAIVQKLDELDAQELVDLQEQIAQHLRQRLQTPKSKHVVTSAGGKIVDDPFKPLTPEQVQADLATLAKMKELAKEISKHWQGSTDAVEIIREERTRYSDRD